MVSAHSCKYILLEILISNWFLIKYSLDYQNYNNGFKTIVGFKT